MPLSTSTMTSRGECYTKSDYLQTKVKNFCIFLEESVVKADPTNVALQKYLENLKVAQLHEVVLYIKSNISPYRNDPVACVDALKKSYEIGVILGEAVDTKLARYMQCFIEIVEL